MKLVIIESPYAGDVEANVAYAQIALQHSLARGEAPIASHLLYPQVLNDEVPEQRTRGVLAGLEWLRAAEMQVFYTDRGWSPGMLAALREGQLAGVKQRFRSLNGKPQEPPE